MKTTLITIIVAVFAFWGGTRFGTTNIDPVIARDNALLRQQVEIQKELIATYEAMVEEIRQARELET